jgi:hypothetical protein
MRAGGSLKADNPVGAKYPSYWETEFLEDTGHHTYKPPSLFLTTYNVHFFQLVVTDLST